MKNRRFIDKVIAAVCILLAANFARVDFAAASVHRGIENYIDVICAGIWCVITVGGAWTVFWPHKKMD